VSIKNVHVDRPSQKGWAIFAALLLIPTILGVVYYYVFAADIYVSESQFSVYSNEDTSQLDAAGALGLSITDNSTKDILVTKEYILSKGLMMQLEKDLNLRKRYTSNKADFLKRLPDNANDNTLLDYYRGMIDIQVYREASLITLNVHAFSAEDAKAINDKILEYAEKFINDLSARIKVDSQTQAQTILGGVEKDIIALKTRISEFRQANDIFDPAQEVASDLEFVSQLESKRAELIAERSIKSAKFKNNSFAIGALNKEIANIAYQIKKQKENLLEQDGENHQVAKDFEVLMLEDEFMKKKYELALFNLEETYRSLQKQGKYIVEVLAPTLPDFPTEPNRSRGVITVFLVSFMGLGIMGLIISGINDHIL